MRTDLKFLLVSLAIFCVAAVFSRQSTVWAGGAVIFSGLFEVVDRITMSKCPNGFERSIPGATKGTPGQLAWECAGWWFIRACLSGGFVMCAMAGVMMGWEYYSSSIQGNYSDSTQEYSSNSTKEMK